MELKPMATLEEVEIAMEAMEGERIPLHMNLAKREASDPVCLTPKRKREVTTTLVRVRSPQGC
ncbi:hypothetical protein A2U01_0097320 [Trifolium medium]|nr:hypothetical protein [Trifolium medium]